MPRQPRPLPAQVGRFYYWHYEFSHPVATTDRPAPSAGRSSHATILKTFRQIRDDIDTQRAQWHRRRAAAHLRDIGIENPTPALLALAYYLLNDRLWTQNREAGSLLAQQSPEVQAALRTWARGVWRRRTPWSWAALLCRIARDQALFQETHALGPTQAGLVGARKYDVSEAGAQRVYYFYHREMSALLGQGRRISARVRADYRAFGIETPRVDPTPCLPDLAGRPAEEHVPIILHWFAHALRNLARYRDGHAPLPWHPTACRSICLQVQRRLMA
jgi:hypothetical protein